LFGLKIKNSGVAAPIASETWTHGACNTGKAGAWEDHPTPTSCTNRGAATERTFP